MNLYLNDKSKIDLLVALFQLLKNCSNYVKFEFYLDHIKIQGMDKSQICLFFTNIQSNWFTQYLNNEYIEILIESNSLFLILSKMQENQTLFMQYNKIEEMLDINVLTNLIIENSILNSKLKKSEFNFYYQIPLLNIEQESFKIPDIDYEAEFSINSKHMSDLFIHLGLFGNELNINCNENEILFETNGEIGKIKVAVVLEDLNEFSINEGEQINLAFSLHHLLKMSLSTKLAKNIDVSLSNNYPIRIKYDLGQESYCLFYIAPKIF